MRVLRPGLLIMALFLAACSHAPAVKPASPVIVLGSTAAPLTGWDKVADVSKPSVVALTVEHGVFDTFPNYLGKLWSSAKNIVSDPLMGAPGLVVTLLFGYFDLSYAVGSGFVISRSGHLMTAAHVVENAQRIAVRLGDEKKWRRAKIIASSPAYDLALLKIVSTTTESPAFRPLKFRNPKKIGQNIAILGYPSRPWAHSNNPITMTQGIVSSLKLEIGEASTRFQTDAPTNAGASGSPVLGEDGSVCGIVCERARPSLLEDQTFAIPSYEMEKAGFIRIRAAPAKKIKHTFKNK